MGGGRGLRGGEETYWVWWENMTERRSLGRPECKWDSNIKISLNEISHRGGWVQLSQIRARNQGYKYLPVAQNAGNFLIRWRSIGLTSSTAQSSQATEGQESTALPLESLLKNVVDGTTQMYRL
jgi:hypothetical protein